MKYVNYFRKAVVVLAALLGFVLWSCDDKQENMEIKLLAPDNNATFDLSTVNNITFSWDKVNGVTDYTVKFASTEGELANTQFSVSAGNEHQIQLSNEQADQMMSNMTVAPGEQGDVYWTVACDNPEVITQTRKISVKRLPPRLDIEGSNEVEFVAIPAGTQTVTIRSNIQWSYTITPADAGWLSIAGASPRINDSELILTAQPNTGAEREATITVSGTGVTDKTITVTQAEGSGELFLIVEPEDLLVMFDSSPTGTKSVTVTSSVPWTIAVTQITDSWLTVVKNDDEAVFTAVANTNAAEREATVTISAAGVDDVVITVKQVGAGVKYLSVSSNTVSLNATNGSTGSVTISSNTTWTVEPADVNWLTVVAPSNPSGDGVIAFQAQQNMGTPRNATVTVSGEGADPVSILVTQAGTGEVDLEVAKTEVMIDSNPADWSSVWVYGDEAEWTAAVQPGAAWLTIECEYPYSDVNSGIIKLIAEPNTSSSSRVATIIVSAPGATSKSITVTQVAAGAKYMNLSHNAVDLEPNADAAQFISVTSNTDWTVTIPSDVTWLSVGEKGIDGFRLEAQMNQASTSRSATVIVSGEGVADKTIAVTQKAAYPPHLYLGNQEIFIPANPEGTYFGHINTNVEWTLTIPSNATSWLSVDKTSGLGFSEVWFTAQPNTGEAQRTAIVTVTATGAGTEQFTITQVGTGAYLNVNTNYGDNQIWFDDEGNNEGVLIIQSNTTWTVTANVSWLNFSQTSGSNDDYVNVTAQPYSGTSDRYGTITITAAGVPTPVTFQVMQQRPYMFVYTDPYDVHFTAAGGQQTVAVESNTTWTASIQQTGGWLSISTTSGQSGSSSFVVTAQANAGAPRTALVVITGAGMDYPRTLSVTQEGTAGGIEINNIHGKWYMVKADYIQDYGSININIEMLESYFMEFKSDGTFIAGDANDPDDTYEDTWSYQGGVLVLEGDEYYMITTLTASQLVVEMGIAGQSGHYKQIFSRTPTVIPPVPTPETVTPCTSCVASSMYGVWIVTKMENGRDYGNNNRMWRNSSYNKQDAVYKLTINSDGTYTMASIEGVGSGNWTYSAGILNIENGGEFIIESVTSTTLIWSTFEVNYSDELNYQRWTLEK